MLPADEQLRLIKRGIVEAFPEDELIRKLRRAVSESKPLRVKLGIDPTTPELHLGHTVVLNKLRQFQQLGHTAVLIIGDYTGQVGDPSQQHSTRKRLTEEEVNRNADIFLKHAKKLLLENNLEIRRNGEWFAEMNFAEVMELASKMTVARLLERDDFASRYSNNIPISLHEFFYPLMQGYDSVIVRADIELGGTDQRYNLAVGRVLQRDAGQEPQVCITLPLLIGTDGTKKMSKTYGNHIAIDDPPKTMFDKLLSIPDTLTRTYLTLLTDINEEEIEQLLSSDDPREAKARLALDVVARLSGVETAKTLEEAYRSRSVPKTALKPVEIESNRIWIVHLIKEAGFAKTSSEARRLIEQGGVSLDGNTITDPKADVTLNEGTILKVGKNRWARIHIRGKVE